MKFTFKKVLHVMLALAVVYACPFSVSAHDGCENCSHSAEFSVYVTENSPVSPQGTICDLLGSHEYDYTDYTTNEQTSTTDEYCYLYYFEAFDVCARCGEEYNYRMEPQYDYSIAHDYEISMTDLGGGQVRKDLCCTLCGYILEGDEIITINRSTHPVYFN